MPRPGDRPGGRKRRRSTVASSTDSRTASVDPFALVGLGTALAQCDHEQEIARLSATAVTSALGVPFGAVVLQGEGEPEERTFGQLGNVALDATLAREIEGFLAVSEADAHGISAQPTNEIDVNEEALKVEDVPPRNARGRTRARTLDYLESHADEVFRIRQCSEIAEALGAPHRTVGHALWSLQHDGLIRLSTTCACYAGSGGGGIGRDGGFPRVPGRGH